jgi:hypothetical protein
MFLIEATETQGKTLCCASKVLFVFQLSFGTVSFGKMSPQNPLPGKCFETEMKSYCSFSRQFKFYFNVKKFLQFKLKVIS